MEKDPSKDCKFTEIVDSSREVPSTGKQTAGRRGPILDYAGSAEKSDPEEIKLVRKLDIWMLVCVDPCPMIIQSGR